MKEIILIWLAVLATIVVIFGMVEYSKTSEREYENRRYFEIKKYKDGYEIYKNGKLEAEFTRQNTDSMSLETLKWIYEGD